MADEPLDGDFLPQDFIFDEDFNSYYEQCLRVTQNVAIPQVPDSFTFDTMMPLSSTPEEEVVEQPSSASAPSSLPAFLTWPGQYDFSVSFGMQEKNPKGASWTYSEMTDKLYVGKDMSCPINFSTNALMPDGVTIRATAMFSSPEHILVAVTKCPLHSAQEIKNGVRHAEHLVRCSNILASYEVHETTNYHSVVIPWDNPPEGQDFTTYLYEFGCFTSCQGGPSRKPLMLVFSLEKHGQVIGRRKLDIKICACPGRDRKTEDKIKKDTGADSSSTSRKKDSSAASSSGSKRKQNDSSSFNLREAFNFTENITIPASKKKKDLPNENEAYVIWVHDAGCYEFLKQMKAFFICSKTIQANAQQNIKSEDDTD